MSSSFERWVYEDAISAMALHYSTGFDSYETRLQRAATRFGLDPEKLRQFDLGYDPEAAESYS